MKAPFPRVLAAALIVIVCAYAAVRVFLRPSHSSAKASPDARTVVRFAHSYLEPGVREAFDAVIDRFERLRPEIRVQQVAVPKRVYSSWVRTQLVGGTAPALMEMGTHDRLELNDDLLARYFSPLNDLLDEPNPHNAGTTLAGLSWRSTFLDGLEGGQSYSVALGENYGVGNTIFTSRVFYNQQLMVEIFGEDRRPADFAEFLAMCEEVRRHATIHDRSLQPIASSRANARPFLIHLFTSQTQHLQQLIDRRREFGVGNQALAYVAGEWSPQEASFRSGVELLREVGAFFQPGFQQLERDDAVFLFSQGRALFIVTGTWDAGSLDSQCPFPLGAFRLPLPGRDDPRYGAYVRGPTPEGGFTYLNLALRAGAPQAEREAAVDFLQFLTSFHGNELFSHLSNWLPAVVEVDPPASVRDFSPQPGTYPRGMYLTVPGTAGELWLQQNYHRLFGFGSTLSDFLDAYSEALPRIVEDTLEASRRGQLNALRSRVITRLAGEQIPERSGDTPVAGFEIDAGTTAPSAVVGARGPSGTQTGDKSVAAPSALHGSTRRPLEDDMLLEVEFYRSEAALRTLAERRTL